MNTPADVPCATRWVATGPAWELRVGAEVLGRFELLPSGALLGLLAGSVLRLAVSTRGRVRLSDRENRDLARFTPDWAGLGPIELADGARYAWNASRLPTGGAEIRDGARRGVMRFLPGDRQVAVDRVATLPDGHGPVLAVLALGIWLAESRRVGDRPPVAMPSFVDEG